MVKDNWPDKDCIVLTLMHQIVKQQNVFEMVSLNMRQNLTTRLDLKL